MGEASTQELPFVSVVIPVLNNAKRLRVVLDALQRQTYPRGKYEVIVVDNGSTDESPRVAQSFEEVRLLFETDHLQSPYSARNRGIETARGEIIALLDSTCEPIPEWIEEGVACLRTENADLVGGEIEFEFGDDVTAGKIFDSLINVRMEKSVTERRVAKTGNLIVRRCVFEEMGLFPEGLRSGGDVRWTGTAVRAGYKLAFGARAIAHLPARPLVPLMQKQWRVAQQYSLIRREAGEEVSFLRMLKGVLRPPSVNRLRRKIEEEGSPFMQDYIIRLWFVGYIVKIVVFCGRLYGLLNIIVRR